MRHRRRIQNTQISKKRHHSVTRAALPRQKKKTKWPFFVIILLLVVSTAFLLFMDMIPLPSLESFRGGGQQSPSGTETTVSAPGREQPAIPTQQEESEPYYSPVQRQIQLEILNGCGVKGIADRLTKLLRKHNYDVVNKGNYLRKGKVDWNVAETRIIDQIGKVDNARQLADAMGVLYSNVESYENPSPIADITIIIGKDYNTLPIFNHQE